MTEYTSQHQPLITMTVMTVERQGQTVYQELKTNFPDKRRYQISIQSKCRKDN